MNRGHNRETLFADAEDCRYFLNLFARYRPRFSFQLYHYCLMSNHFHVLLRMESAPALRASWPDCCARMCITSTAAMDSWGTCGKAVSKAWQWMSSPIF